MTPVDTAVSLPRLTLVELRKLVDTRAGSWLLATIGLLTAAIVTIDLIWGDRANLTLGNLLADAVLVPSLLLPVLGILLITSEWSQRTHLVTFTLVPNRGRVAVAKIAAGVLAGVSAIVVCLALAAVGTLIGDWTGDIAGWSLRWSHVGNATLVLALSMLMGIAFGMVLLNSPLAIVVYFVLPTVWSVLGAMIPSLNRVAEWLDTAVTIAGPVRAERAGRGVGPPGRLGRGLDRVAPGRRAGARDPARGVLTGRWSAGRTARGVRPASLCLTSPAV